MIKGVLRNFQRVISMESSTEKSFSYTTKKISPFGRNDLDLTSATDPLRMWVLNYSKPFVILKYIIKGL